MTNAPDFLKAQRVEGKQQLIFQSRLPPGHGYTRGRFLALFREISDGDKEPVGYGRVLRVSAETMDVLVAYLPETMYERDLWLGDFPRGAHIGKQIGHVVSPFEGGLFVIDVGKEHGVRAGDVYQVYDGIVAEPAPGGNTIDHLPSGMLKVTRVNSSSSVTKLVSGYAPRGGWIEFLTDQKYAESGKIPDVTVLFLHLETNDSDNDWQKTYIKGLKDGFYEHDLVQSQKIVKVSYRVEAHGALDDERVRRIGEEHGADFVVWGSVVCTNGTACVRPRITIVSPEEVMKGYRSYGKHTVNVEQLLGAPSDIANMDDVISAIASVIAGAIYYRSGDMLNAVFHLERAIRSSTSPDMLFATTMLRTAYFRVGEWDKSYALIALHLDVAAQAGLEWMELRALYERSALDVRRGSYNRALKTARDIRSRNSGEDKELEVVSWVITAEAMWKTGKPSAAVSVLDARVLSAIHGDQLMALAFHLKADILHSMGQDAKAEKLWRDSVLPLLRSSTDPDVMREIAVVLGKLGGIEEGRGNLEEAFRIWTEEQIPVLKKFGDKRELAVAHWNIASVLARIGEVDVAIGLFMDDVIPVLDELDDVRELGVALNELGGLLYESGKTGLAEKIYDANIERFSNINAPLELASTYGNIAGIAFDRGHWNEALEIRLKHQMPILQDSGYRKQEAYAWGAVALALVELGKLDEALVAVRDRQLPVMIEIDNARGIADAKSGIARVYRRMGEVEKAQKLLVDDVIPMLSKLNDQEALVYAWSYLADIYHDENDYGNALDIRMRAQLPIFESRGDKIAVATTWAQICDIYDEQGQFEEALKLRTNRVIPVYVATDQEHGLALTWGKIAMYHTRKGNYSKAIRILEKEVLPRDRKLDDIYGTIEDTAALGSNYLLRGRRGDERKGKAILDRAIKAAEGVEHPNLEQFRGIIRVYSERAAKRGKLNKMR